MRWPPNETRLRRWWPCRRWSYRRWWLWLDARRSVGKQFVENVECRIVGSPIERKCRLLHLRCRGQIGFLFAEFAERWRWLDHHHAAAFGTRQDLANRSWVAHLQP